MRVNAVGSFHHRADVFETGEGLRFQNNPSPHAPATPICLRGPAIQFHKRAGGCTRTKGRSREPLILTLIRMDSIIFLHATQHCHPCQRWNVKQGSIGIESAQLCALILAGQEMVLYRSGRVSWSLSQFNTNIFTQCFTCSQTQIWNIAVISGGSVNAKT
jgi:hypothetical protein